MSSLPVARVGRHKQRYQDHLRLVSGCIPYRFEKNDEELKCHVENRVRVLMISTPNRDDLVFPKGGWETDETVREAACREALEEAGVRGILSESPLGMWEFRSKSRENSSSLKGGCRGYMFALKVTEELDSWPEQSTYCRKWLTAEDAFKFCRYDWMRESLANFLTCLDEEMIIGATREILELPNIPPDTGADHQILPQSYFEKPSAVQHLETSSTKCIVQG
ncbi:nudix hydrolase 13, mitochondrial-like [Rutidosis leptorrhynchoides]|uniref:nudix hydrolase 13, mitochondrial-like n=1 Tax=Rutidosis leptorrhynchoides TaxID=125765 RepID=UPI003A99C4D4